MNFLQLKYFLTICDYQSISKAALKLYISQSALSQQLIHMEHELDVQLFNRHGSTLTLTEAGRHFSESSHKILFEFQNTQNIMESLKENGSKTGKGHITIAVTKTKSFMILVYLLPSFQKRYPDIEIEIVEVDSGEVEKLINNGSVDLGFCFGNSTTSIIYEEIYKEPILLAIPPQTELKCTPAENSFSFPSIHFDSFFQEPFIIGTTGYLRDFTLEIFKSHEKPLNLALETAVPAFAHLLTAANVGCTFIGKLSTFIEPMHIDKPHYCLLDPPFYQKVCIGYHKQRYVTKPMRYFISYAKDAMSLPPFNF